MWTVYLRNYPQWDIDMAEYWDLEDFFHSMSRSEAIKTAAELTEIYADEDWAGHRLYKEKFYAGRCTVHDAKQIL